MQGTPNTASYPQMMTWQWKEGLAAGEMAHHMQMLVRNINY